MAISSNDVRPGRLEPVTPGEILLEEFLRPLGLSARALARDLAVPSNRVTAILNGSRGITADAGEAYVAP